MENSFSLALVSALWIGIMTSISPCPLATNIAAISYISRNIKNSRSVFLSGLLYTAGRTLVYLVLSMVAVGSLLSIPKLSFFLQEYMNKLLGPVLIIVGMFLLGLITITLPGSGVSEGARRAAEKSGVWGAGFLGVLFALSFCPVSAALFFGVLVPLAVKFKSMAVLPVIFGIGTGLPVIVFAGIIAFSVQSLGKAFDVLTKIDLWTRRIVGTVFIGAGLYMSLRYVFNLI